MKKALIVGTQDDDVFKVGKSFKDKDVFLMLRLSMHPLRDKMYKMFPIEIGDMIDIYTTMVALKKIQPNDIYILADNSWDKRIFNAKKAIEFLEIKCNVHRIK